jgi:hypothetical protein
MSGATGQTMPNAHAASVSYSKVYDYLLNPMHPDNSGKAQFFVGFGFTSLRWDILRDALQAHPLSNLVANTIGTPHGMKYDVRCHVQSPDGRNPCIRSIWIIESHVGPDPRLVTAYAYP